MGSSMDDAKGRMKEAAGAVGGDKDLEREGKLDQAGASVKEKLEGAKDKLGDFVDSAKDKINEKK